MRIQPTIVLGVTFGLLACAAIGQERGKIPGRNSSADAGQIRLQRALDSQFDCSFDNEPLSQVLDQIALKAQVSLSIDEESLQTSGIRIQANVTLKLRRVTLSNVLKIVLDQFQLVPVVENGFIKITPRYQSGTKSYVRKYSVADLVEGPTGRTSDNDLQLLLAAIQSTTGEIWDAENEEQNSIIADSQTGVLTVRQPLAGHHEVRGLLQAIRKAKSTGRQLRLR